VTSISAPQASPEGLVATTNADPATPWREVGPEALKALAHPLRLRLLAELDDRGRATATQLGEALSESSGSTSYHLRQLFRHGFIDEDETPTAGRERFWRARRGGWSLPAFHLAQDAGSSPAVDLVLREMSAEDERRLSRIWAIAPTWSLEWRERIRRTQARLTLDPEQAEALQDELDAVLDRYRDLPAQADSRRVLLLVDLLPTEFRPDGSVAT
jgi:DNA-binding transcriptional ArsR family regulator